ncbi:HAMP domain-containing histidine kinase [Streptomyces californicus]
MLYQNPNRQLLAYTFAPAAATVLGILLVFGLVGGVVLAGRMSPR